ncbi:MAG: carboxylesterase/lipase family protein [Roseburia sp.]|nr:carboxylesterase/lipase family protein [Roseburia sp.]MCM1096649.1 carboxylesterase/lipase family protein [Ruminococcus flavefaciens]
MIIETKSGKVKGYPDHGMIAFKGIPFAKPPVGELRFKPPVPVEPWDGVFDACSFGKRSLQTGEQGYCDDIGFSEDCLNLNIWIPDSAAEKRPVIFYIHGGGHFSGANSDTFFDGPHLIGDREAVMVAPNYRLGALGYLYLKEYLGEEYADSGNCGLLDQILALKWVQENIEAFGGDKDTVILMGQSAGAKSAANLIVTPAAKGLFRRAILQSGATQCIRDTHTASKLAEIMLKELGLRKSDAAQILTVDGEQIIEAQKRAYRQINIGHLFGPVLDGRTILETPEEYLRSGKAGELEVLIGYNRQELYYSDPAKEKTDEEAASAFRAAYGKNWKTAMEKYRQFCGTEPAAEAFDHVQTEFVYGNATLRLTQLLAENGVKTWSYLWNFTGNRTPYHFTEMAYIFRYTAEESPEKGYDRKDAAYAVLMNETWMSFILTGNPENVLLPRWLPCTTSEMGWRMYFDERPHLEQFNLRSYYLKQPMQVIRL